VTGRSDVRHHKQSEGRRHRKHAQLICSVPAACPCPCAGPWPPAAAAAAAAGAAAACMLPSGGPFASPPRSGSPWPSYETHTSSPSSSSAAAGAGMTGSGSSSSWRLHSPQKPRSGLRHGLICSPVPVVLRRHSSAGAVLAPAPAVATGNFWSPQKHSAAVVAAARSRAVARECAHSNQSAYSSPSRGLAGPRVGTAGSSSKWLLQAGWQECRQGDQQALAAEAATLAAESQVVAAAIKCTARLL
jgi:hypothetical protein